MSNLLHGYNCIIKFGNNTIVSIYFAYYFLSVYILLIAHNIFTIHKLLNKCQNNVENFQVAFFVLQSSTLRVIPPILIIFDTFFGTHNTPSLTYASN